mmetsp:Transcript_2306/g.6418  ORF Transcript_2306/g.6418 Transcript_2306/m.6418 type:complete len:331 (+) Transcript_2306:104-1096(+)|eukprot:CAMPEP_0119132082 /NCGR_PEP_ID=MMETSP1310-20130426/11402_1 /TAXON_ID=464262 /ORGANISM="Genus nov. species nov., Strain RCC2339" /LENGTH=330 /DNA_ID=CAMNT_0007122693 /DNA_START=88 /DNA_END=1080 /DNA_ORIENTATION=+
MDEHVVGTTQAERDLARGKEAKKKNMTFRDHLVNTDVQEISGNRILEEVDRKDSIKDALALFQKHRIQSLPVHNPVKQAHVAFLDVLDIMVFTLGIIQDVKAGTVTKEQAQEKWGKATCGELADCSGRDPFSPVGLRTSVFSAIQKFVKWKAHRLPIIDPEGELIHLLSQFRVIEYLEEHVGASPIASRTVGDLKLGYKDGVYSIKETQTVAEGFQVINEKKVYGIAVLNGEGRIVGNLSASDIRRVVKDGALDFDVLALSVSSFIKAGIQSDDRTIEGVVCVQASTTVEEVTMKFVVTKVHRLYVIDENERLLGIISTIDLLTQLSRDL